MGPERAMRPRPPGSTPGREAEAAGAWAVSSRRSATGCTRAWTGGAPPRWTSASTRSTAGWNSDARPTSAPPDSGRGRDQSRPAQHSVARRGHDERRERAIGEDHPGRGRGGGGTAGGGEGATDTGRDGCSARDGTLAFAWTGAPPESNPWRSLAPERDRSCRGGHNRAARHLDSGGAQSLAIAGREGWSITPVSPKETRASG